MDIDALLQPRGEDAPSGDDLEYDPAFIDLEITAQHGEERQMGEEIVAGDDPDYKEVSQKAFAILERSHDLRAAIFLAEAELRLNGLRGFADATSYIRRCLDEHWGTCHPQLDADDDDDPTMRVNAVLALADTQRILSGVRRAPMTASRMFGAMSLRHIEAAEGDIPAPADMDAVPDPASIAAAFQDTDEETLQALATAAATALADARAISAKFDTETPGRGPDLDPLIKLLRKISGRLNDATGGSGAEEGDAVAEDISAQAASAAPMGGAAQSIGGINSHNDVRNAIDRIIAFYERAEPSSPVPILLGRAKKLVGADFLTIVKDMAPDGIHNVHLVGGISEIEEYE